MEKARHGKVEGDVVIVGAGHAAAQACAALRQGGFVGSIIVIGAEPELPYERPPLSKDYLLGGKSFDRLLIRPPTFYEERNIELMLGVAVTTIDPGEHRVVLADGRLVGYRHLIWAAGGSPRRLACEGSSLAGVHAIRSRADVEKLKSELPSISNVVVIGGGYIGLEAAAVLRKLGKRITIVEALDRVLARVAGEPLSLFFQEEHRRQGAELRLGSSVESILGTEGRCTGVRLSTGEVLAADGVIVGIGIQPEVGPLAAAGAQAPNGISVDKYCRTSVADIFAVGDLALHSNAYADGRHIRLESVQNANDQASVVARYLLGNPVEYDAVPWFWSNQYDLRLQTVGLSEGYDECVVRGDIADRAFSLVYLRDGRVIALDCVNSTKDYAQGKALVTGRCRVSAAQLQDTSISLKSLAAV